MAYAIEGKLLKACSCGGLCPCWRSQSIASFGTRGAVLRDTRRRLTGAAFWDRVVLSRARALGVRSSRFSEVGGAV